MNYWLEKYDLICMIFVEIECLNGFIKLNIEN